MSLIDKMWCNHLITQRTLDGWENQILVAAPQGSYRLQVLDRAGERVWNTSGELVFETCSVRRKGVLHSSHESLHPRSGSLTRTGHFLIFYWPLAHPDFKFQKDSPTRRMSTKCSNSIRSSDARTDGRDSPENPSTKRAVRLKKRLKAR